MLEEYREYLKQKRWQFKETVNQPCSDEENAIFAKLTAAGKELPKGIKKYNDPYKEGQYYYKKLIEVPENEIAEYLQYKQYDAIQTIRGCVVFFTVLTVISVVASIISIVSIMS